MIGSRYGELYKEFCARWKEIILLDSVKETLLWDEETYMPEGSAELRGEQSGFLTKLGHERYTNDGFYEILQELKPGIISGNIEGLESANITIAIREVEKRRRIPSRLAEEIAKQASISQVIWREARRSSDFQKFAPALDRMLSLKREQAGAIGFNSDPYEALFAQYEPGISLAEADLIFTELEEKLVPYISRVLALEKQPDTSVLTGRFDAKNQEILSRYVLNLMGFDFSRGRLDVSIHPFTAGVSPWDVRVTTRYREDYFGDAIFSTIHEGGHGLYELGASPSHFGTPVGYPQYSLGLHESQSRLWEVWIARSLQFFECIWPAMQALFPGATLGRKPFDFFAAVNKPQRSFIRTESDPTTYNLHILLRFKLERKMVRGDIAVGDLPEFWNELTEKYLGIRPENDAQGILQDIHWSEGLFGYFPTYTLGNIASAVIWDALRHALPVEEAILKEGRFQEIREWLREKIHQHGAFYSLPETLERLGGSLNVDVFMSALQRRIRVVYGVIV